MARYHSSNHVRRTGYECGRALDKIRTFMLNDRLLSLSGRRVDAVQAQRSIRNGGFTDEKWSVPRCSRLLGAILLMFFVLPRAARSAETPKPTDIRTYKTIDTTELKAHIFLPAHAVKGELHPAIILLHGGGWNVGSADWMHDDAKWYADFNMVAIAGEYRLSDQKSTTPIEAMADTRDLVRWVREHATDLAVDPHKIAITGCPLVGSSGRWQPSSPTTPKAKSVRPPMHYFCCRRRSSS